VEILRAAGIDPVFVLFVPGGIAGPAGRVSALPARLSRRQADG
jgi:hypothetical protein